MIANFKRSIGCNQLFSVVREAKRTRGSIVAFTLPGDLEAQVDAFVGYYNHQRYHESLNNLTPADVYTGRGQTILLEREKIKRRTALSAEPGLRR